MSGRSVPPWLARALAAWAVALLLGTCAYQLAATMARELPRPHPLEELSYYPSGQGLELATLGHAETFADLAWMRAVQYYGEHRTSDMRFTRLYHVFDILTSLSPRFVPAYVFGGFSLAQEGGQFARAEALMLKGIEENPTSGLLAFELGFLYYVKPGGRDLERAGEYFEQAARLPDGPPSARRFAAYVRQNAGDFAVARALWLEVVQHSDNRFMREMAEREIRKIDEALATGRSELARKRLATPGVLIQQNP
jgi:hypothetical protein